MPKLSALSPFSPLRSILDDVQRAIDAKLYYPALLVSLTIPEICAAMTLENNIFVKEKHYVAFVDRYTTPSDLGIDGVGCYWLRGGVVHRANMAGHPKANVQNVIFTVPEARGKFHGLNIQIEESRKVAFMFDLGLFCDAMIKAAEAWYEDHQHHPKVIENMKMLIRYRRDGAPIFHVKGPVVASGE